MGNERLTLEIAAKAIGQESIDQLTASLDRFSAAAESAGKRAAAGFTGAGAAAKGAGEAAESATPNIRKLLLSVKDLAEGRTTFATVEAGYFISSLGGIATAAGFAAVGIAAVAYGISRVRREIAEGGQKMGRVFDEVNGSLSKSNDELRISLDRLENEKLKLEAKPQNNIKLALDEAKLSADELGSSLRNAMAALEGVFKANGIGAFKGLVTQQSSTSPIQDEVLKMQVRLDRINREGQDSVRGAGSRSRAKSAQLDYDTNLKGELDADLGIASSLVEKYELMTKFQKQGLSAAESANYVKKFGPIDTTSIDSQRALISASATLENLNSQRDEVSLRSGIRTVQPQVDKLKADKDLAETQKKAAQEVEERRRAIDEFGRKALNPVEEIYARRDEAARRNKFTPSERDQLDENANRDVQGELKKQIYEQRNQFKASGQLWDKNKAEDRTLGPDGDKPFKDWGENLLKDLKANNALNNKIVTDAGAEAVRANAAGGAFADKMTGLNPALSDTQKIAAINLQDLETAKQKHQIELDMAAGMATVTEQNEAAHKADLANELELQKIKEENIEKLAELENKKIEEFRGLVGGLFDAATSHTPNAIPNFVKSQVLNVGKTVSENIAEEYLFKPLQKMIPTSPGGALGAILKGTGLTKDANDPLKSAGTQLYSAGSQLIAAARALATSRSGGGGGIPSGAGVSAAGAGGDTDVYGNPIAPGMGNDGLPISGGGLNVALAQSAGLGAKNALANSVEGALFDPNASTTSKITSGIATAGVIAGGAIAAYQGFKKGGAQGALDGIGAIAGTAAALDPEPISKAVLAVAAIAMPLIGSFFNGPQRRANAINTELGQAQYVAPQALNATQNSSGDFTDFDARGNIRSSDFSAVPQVREGSTWEQTHGLFGGPPTFYNVPGGQTSQYGAANGGSTAPAPPAQPIIIQAMDVQSFADFATKNHAAIGNAAAKALQSSHAALTTEVKNAANYG